MEPRFNIRVAELGAPSIDNNFIQQGEQWVGDYLDTDSNHFDQNFKAYDEQRQGLGNQIQHYVDEAHIHAQDVNPAQDPTLMVLNEALTSSPDLAEVPTKAAARLASQANGFRSSQAREDFTMGIVANLSTGTLVNSRVVAETPTTKIAGTVIAVGDQEFAVIWDDKTASVERKSDYELVVTE